MLIVRLACPLSAFAFFGAHAENCSGGAGGGMDETGNQCSSLGSERDAAQAALGLERVAVAAATARPPVDRFIRIADPPSEAVPGARTDSSGEATCSGGSSGGMDATGNQCSQAGFSERVAGSPAGERQTLAGLRD